MEIKKKDWKLFMERVPEWQEKYMERLLKEYVAYLESGEPASTKFWGLEKRIKDDKRTLGVQLRLEKQNMDFDLARMVKDGVIGFKDLEGFSDEMIDRVLSLVNR